MKIAIVILNWNGRTLLETYLPSVVANTPDSADIYLVDNASTDDSVIYTQENFQRIKIITLDRNYGFSEGYNRSLIQIKADIFVLLNSDVEVTFGWLNGVAEKFQSDPKIAALQPKIKSYTDKEHFEYAGAAGGFIDKWGFTFCRGRIFDHLEKDNGQYNQPTEIFWASGACLFIRADIYNDLGGLDKEFFAHMEEIDLCWRIKNSGYSIWYHPSSVIYHLGGGTLSQVKWQKSYLNFRNNLFLLLKNDYSKGFFFKFIFRMILDGIAGMKFLLDGYPMHTYSVLKAHLSMYSQLGSMLSKRRQLKKKRRNPNLAGVIHQSIIWSYFIQKKKTFSKTLD